MKKKTIWSLVLALALVVSAIGTATSAFAATSAPMEPVTKIATENEDAIWEHRRSNPSIVYHDNVMDTDFELPYWP